MRRARCAFVAAALVGGCKALDARVASGIAGQFAGDRTMASRLCGREVRGLAGIVVTAVQLESNARDGSGSASVSAQPLETAHTVDVAPPSPCQAIVTFDYLDAPRWRHGVGFLGETLQVYSVAIDGVPAALGPQRTDERAVVPAVPTGTQLELRRSYNGSLAVGDPVLPDGRRYDDWTIDLVAGEDVTIAARASHSPTSIATLDMYLILMRGGVELTHNDDSGGTLDSSITYVAPSAGTYVARVTTFSATSSPGDYTIAALTPAPP